MDESRKIDVDGQLLPQMLPVLFVGEKPGSRGMWELSEHGIRTLVSCVWAQPHYCHGPGRDAM